MSWPLWRVEVTGGPNLGPRDVLAASVGSFVLVPVLLMLCSAVLGGWVFGDAGEGERSRLLALVLPYASFLGAAGLMGWIALPLGLPILFWLRRRALLGLIPAVLTGGWAEIITVVIAVVASLRLSMMKVFFMGWVLIIALRSIGL